MAAAFGLLLMLVPLVVLGYLVGGRALGTPTDPAVRNLLRVYLYLGAFASQLIAALGLIFLGIALASALFGPGFSYPPFDSSCAPATSADFARQFRFDLITGGSLTLVGGLLCLGHGWWARRIETPEERSRALPLRLYWLLTLALYGLGSILALPIAVHQGLTYLLSPARAACLGPHPPAGAIAAALVLVPIWLLALWRLGGRVRSAGRAPRATANTSFADPVEGGA